MIIKRIIAPDSNRITVKLDASMALFSNAILHSIELAANAINANPVRTMVLSEELLIKAIPWRSLRYVRAHCFFGAFGSGLIVEY